MFGVYFIFLEHIKTEVADFRQHHDVKIKNTKQNKS